MDLIIIYVCMCVLRMMSISKSWLSKRKKGCGYEKRKKDYERLLPNRQVSVAKVARIVLRVFVKSVYDRPSRSVTVCYWYTASLI